MSRRRIVEEATEAVLAQLEDLTPSEEKANSMAEWLERPDPGAGYWGRARGPEYDIRAVKVYT